MEEDYENARCAGEVPPIVWQHDCSKVVCNSPRPRDTSPSNISSAIPAAQETAQPSTAPALPVTQDRAKNVDGDAKESPDNVVTLRTNTNENVLDEPRSIPAGSSCHHVGECRIVTPQRDRRPFRSLENIIHELPLSPPGAPRKVRPSNIHSQHRIEHNSIPFDLMSADESSSPNESSGENCVPGEPECPDSPSAMDAMPNMESERGPTSLLLARRDNLNFSSVHSASGIIKIAVALSIDSSFVGELRISPHSSTGTRSTFQNNEFYFVCRGYLEWDIDATRVRVCAGDFIGVPRAASYNILNPSFQEAVVIYFSPACHFP